MDVQIYYAQEWKVWKRKRKGNRGRRFPTPVTTVTPGKPAKPAKPAKPMKIITAYYRWTKVILAGDMLQVGEPEVVQTFRVRNEEEKSLNVT